MIGMCVDSLLGGKGDKTRFAPLLLVVVGLSAATAVHKPAIADKLDAALISTGAVYVAPSAAERIGQRDDRA